MDAITPTSEDEKMAVDGGQEPMTEDYFRGGKKRKLDEEENSEEETLEMKTRKKTEKEKSVAASSVQKESPSHRLDERKDDADDVFQKLVLLREVLKEIEEKEIKKLRKIAEKLKRAQELEKAAALVKQGLRRIKTADRGVYVQASTLDSLEAFLEHLTSLDIPYFAVNIGPVEQEDVMKASTMLEYGIHYATILAFDVKVERDVQMRADAVGVRIIPVDSIQQEGDQFFKYREEHLKKREALSQAIFPCICEALTSGEESFEVIVEQGCLRVGTPLLARDRGNLELGVVTSMSAADGSSVDMAKAGGKVKIQMKAAEKPVPVWRKDLLISRVTWESYDFCKRYCWVDFSVEERDLLLQLSMASNLRV